MFKKNNRSYWELILYVVLFSLVYIVNIAFSFSGAKLRYGDIYLSTEGVSGLFSSLEILLIIIITARYLSKGIIVSSCLILINSIISLIIMFTMKGNVYSISGLTMTLTAIGAIAVLSGFVRRTEQHDAEMKYQAEHDMLTDLPNRRALNDYLNSLVDSYTDFALVFVDLNNFKMINDTKGHMTGDEILVRLTKRWINIVDSNEFIARLGGDEFAIILRSSFTTRNVKDRMAKYKNELERETKIGNDSFNLSASFGVSFFPGDTKTTDRLFSYADAAMYVSKNKSDGDICFFEHSQVKDIEGDIRLDMKMKDALKMDYFRLMYQPQFYAQTKKLRGYEVLIRLEQPDGSTISPGVFIPEAEKSNLIIEIDKWVLKNALTGYNQPYRLSVNISARHLCNGNLANDVYEILAETHFPTALLEIEITESAFIESMDVAIIELKKLQRMGIKIALDDFGTGYSSLNYLKELPADVLKVDKSFVDTLSNGTDEKGYVEMLINLGKRNGKEIVAEGIESEEQLEILRQFGCDYIQGDLWGMPLTLEETQKLFN